MPRVKKYDKNREDFFSHFKIEQMEDGTINTECGIKHQEFVKWVSMIFDFIQNCFEYQKVKNYITVEMQLGKQKIEFSLLKQFGTGPHALRKQAEKKLDNVNREQILEILWKHSNISNGIYLKEHGDFDNIVDDILKLKEF